MSEHKVPSKIDGVPVEQMGEPLEMNGERWLTLVPPGEDERIWEFSVTSGRLVLTRQ